MAPGTLVMKLCGARTHAAIEQCMFRILDVVDPDDVEAGAIIRLEHEVRSVTKADGTKYKSCPLEVQVAAPAAA